MKDNASKGSLHADAILRLPKGYMMEKTKSQDLEENLLSEPLTSELTGAGYGEWSSGVNGYKRFLEAAISHSKLAIEKCREAGLEEEREIFIKRLNKLQQKLNDEISMNGNSSNDVGA